MNQRQIHSYEDSTNREASYESLLDLMTLISFVFILAATFYVAQAGQISQTAGRDNSASVVSRMVEQGSAAQPAIPHDEIYIVLYKEQATDMLLIIDGMTGTPNRLNATTENIDKVLDKFAMIMNHAKTIDVTVYESAGRINPGILVGVQRWLASHGYNQYHIYFL
jgi:hypothetical protein